MKFAPDRHVFPGGAFDLSDESPQWQQVFSQAASYSTKKSIHENFSDVCLTKFNPNNIKRPNRFLSKQLDADSSKTLPPEISYRLTAIRETFEETGMLMARKINEVPPNLYTSFLLDESTLNEWRVKVHNNSDEFLNMFLQLKLLPNLHSVHEWSNWVAPVDETKRFDTMFFSCFIDRVPKSSNLNFNESESQTLEFFTPQEALDKYRKLEIRFFPPQLYELTRLTRFGNIDELARYSRERQLRGGICTRMPIFVTYKNQRMGVFPKDDLYGKSAEEIDKMEDVKNVDRSLRFSDKNKGIYFSLETNKIFDEEH